MILINNLNMFGTKITSYGEYSFHLNEFRKNLAANVDQSPLIHSCGYESAGDRPTLFAIFSLNFVPFIQYAGPHVLP